MGKYVGSVCRLCRREGEKLFLKGPRCYTHRCAIERRDYAPGQHGAAKSTKLSNFGIQLREKQKVKRIYGLAERQFKNYFEKATQIKGVTGTSLLMFLERRLDNVIYQMGFCTSRRQARQLVGHGYVFVNGGMINIPSYQAKLNDEIEIRFKKKGQGTVEANLELSKNRNVPTWLAVEPKAFKAKIVRLPSREDISYPVNEQLIVELYSR